MNLIKEHSAGFVLFREVEGQREYLILHYPRGHFEFPKGHLEEGETEEDAAIRELMEETSIENIEIIDGYKNKIEYNIRKNGELIGKDVVFFLAKTHKEDIKLSHEHQGSLWLPYTEAKEKVTFNNAKILLEKAETHLTRMQRTK